MALLRRQYYGTYEYFDDQNPTVWNLFVGSWTRYADPTFDNYTLTATSTPGASLSFAFIGSQVTLYSGLNANDTTGGFVAFLTLGSQIVTYPTADYKIDDSPVSPQKPFVDSGGRIIYLQTPTMTDGTHKIDIVVRSANAANQFIVDYFAAFQEDSASPSTPSSTVTPSSLPITATNSTPVDTIVGGVVGSVTTIIILAIAMWYFLKRRLQAQHKPGPGDHIEPFIVTTTTSAPLSPGFRGPGPQSAYSRQTIIGSLLSRPRSRRAVLVTQNRQDVQQPMQEEDDGVRLDKSGEQEAGPSQVPNRVPPTHTPH